MASSNVVFLDGSRNLTAEQAKRLLSYDPVTGEFRWRCDRGSNKVAGMAAGSVCTRADGLQYLKISIGRKLYAAHRLAWLMSYGEWPHDQVDHIDGNGLNNCLANLRQATRSENARNRGVFANSARRLKGVSWHKKSQSWIARIQSNGVRKSLGEFDSAEAAYAAYCAAAATIHGQFARLK